MERVGTKNTLKFYCFSNPSEEGKKWDKDKNLGRTCFAFFTPPMEFPVMLCSINNLIPKVKLYLPSLKEGISGFR